MRIDLHVHVTPQEIIDNFKKIGEREPYFGLLSNTPHNRFATAKDVVEEMARVGIDRSVIFGFSFQDMGLCQYVNDYVIESVEQYPNQLIGWTSVVPNHPKAIYEIERCYNKGLRGIGELFPAGQPFDLTSHKDMDDFAQCCQHYKLPVMLHTNEPVGHEYAGKTDTPLRDIETFIEHYPELVVILAHFGGGLFCYELMKEVREKFANVYYDNATAIFLYDKKIYETFRAIGILDKLLFGSDYPLLSPKRYESSLIESGLTKEEQAAIYGGNAQRLWNKIEKIK